jgi:Na+/H+ antiporter NhaC
LKQFLRFLWKEDRDSGGIMFAYGGFPFFLYFFIDSIIKNDFSWLGLGIIGYCIFCFYVTGKQYRRILRRQIQR